MRRLIAFAAVFGVFAAGVAVGALALHLATRPATDHHPARFHPLDGGVLHRLDLDREQAERLDVIFERHRSEIERLRSRMEPRVRDLVLHTEREVEGVLTPGQLERLQRLRGSRRGHRSGPSDRGRGDRRHRRSEGPESGDPAAEEFPDS